MSENNAVQFFGRFRRPGASEPAAAAQPARRQTAPESPDPGDGAEQAPMPAPAPMGPPPAPTTTQLQEAARLIVRAEGHSLATLLFGAMIEESIDASGHDATDIRPRRHTPAHAADADPAAEARDGRDDTDTGRGGPAAADAPQDGPDAAQEDMDAPGPAEDEAEPDANAPEVADYRVIGQFGERARDLYYRNLPAFVEGFVAHVLAFQQNTSSPYRWVEDWWRWPQIVFPLDALWRGYEAARKQPAGMMVWYMQLYGVLDRVFNPDRGIVASLPAAQTYTDRGQPLPCAPPPADWRQRITATLAVGHDEPLPAGGREDTGRAPRGPRYAERTQ
ncbi:MAG: DUF4913 domain-containing protein [Bifidobacterium choerinum]